MKAKRKRPYVKILYTGDLSIREIIASVEKPQQEDYEPAEDGKSAISIVGPFRTNAGAELFKRHPNKFKTVAEADKAAARIELEKM